jgi:S-adenosylmethionine:tRNA ribosyltransferase-isomerase
VRTLEACAVGNQVQAGSGWTDIFIYPGYEFQIISGLITNFHLPKSTLLMLVCALAGKERVLSVYQEAINREYRFFSFGDAMLIM